MLCVFVKGLGDLNREFAGWCENKNLWVALIYIDIR